ncbi:MAG: EthD family reductase [Planctomycetes bacterium]|nr:EthD family reductase [Planctomycetota bacterium]
MSVSYFIRYVADTKEPETFLNYYRTKHAEIMKKYPRVRGFKLHLPVEWHDPVPVNKDKIFMLGEFVFDSLEDLNFALASEARLEARADVKYLPNVLENADIRHLAVKTEVLF